MNNTNNRLNPYWITGFVDAEGCFTVSISQSKSSKNGWQIHLGFKIALHKRDKELLEKIKLHFNEVGTIYIHNKMAHYHVCNKNDLTNIILPHFYKYPLITNKQGDFKIFSDILKIMNNKEHLSNEGLMKLINLRASLNLGLSKKLKLFFSEVIKVNKPKIIIPKNINYNWLAGFFSGEGCFFIEIYKTNYLRLRILINQHSKEKLLINNFIHILNCGSVISLNNFVVFSVSNFKDIFEKIIPFFQKYKIEGIKSIDFNDFCKAAELINNKAHLTLEGLEKIKSIKSRMNRARYNTT